MSIFTPYKQRLRPSAFCTVVVPVLFARGYEAGRSNRQQAFLWAAMGDTDQGYLISGRVAKVIDIALEAGWDLNHIVLGLVHYGYMIYASYGRLGYPEHSYDRMSYLINVRHALDRRLYQLRGRRTELRSSLGASWRPTNYVRIPPCSQDVGLDVECICVGPLPGNRLPQADGGLIDGRPPTYKVE